METRTHQAGWIENAELALPARIGPAVDAKADNSHLKSLVEPARLLLDYAVAHGLVESAAIIDPIVKLESEIEADVTPTAATWARFFKSYSALCKITYGVSAESLGVEAQRDQRRTRNIYFGFLAVLLLMAVPLTTISTVGGKLTTDAVTQIASTCKDYPVLYCDSSTRNQETSYDHYPYSVNDLTSRTAHISQNLWVLAFFVDWLEGSNLHGDLANVSPKINANVWSSFLETFYRSGTIVDRFKLYYGTIANYLLPIIFGMLGAVTFGLRELRQKTEPPTWGRRGGALAILRICVAGLAGYLVTVIGDLTTEFQISLIFAAFLFGYSIDVFFTLLDRAVAYIKAANSAQGANAEVPVPPELPHRSRSVHTT